MLIAQVTDMHVTAPGELACNRVDTVAALDACVTHLNALDPRPDVVLLTGDVTEFGRRVEVETLKDLLGPLAIPYFMVPGNHDDRDILREVFPDAAPAGAGRFVQYVIDDFPLRLVGIDTVEAGRPHGALCAERLDWITQELSDGPDRPRLLFMHHPPFKTGIRHMDAMCLREGAEALGSLVAGARGVQAIICGHLHRSIHTLWHGVPVSTAPSPAHQVTLDLRPGGPASFTMEPPAYHLHWWMPDRGVVTHTGYIGRYDGPYAFFGDMGSPLT